MADAFARYDQWLATEPANTGDEFPEPHDERERLIEQLQTENIRLRATVALLQQELTRRESRGIR